MVFDGREFAKKIADGLQVQVREATHRLGRKPRLMVLGDPANEVGARYTRLKAQMAASLGVDFQVSLVKPQISTNTTQIETWNGDSLVDGIMVQLPFAGSEVLVPLIDPRKDVDGLRADSPYLPAVVRAVVATLEEAKRRGFDPLRLQVVGNKGWVGSRLQKQLGCAGMDVVDFNPQKLRQAEGIISCTGRPDVIDGSMVTAGFVAIDVGAPRPEFTADALAKASFFTPVPGGIGPVTVVMLFANLLDALV